MRTTCIKICTFLLLVSCNENAINNKKFNIKGCVIDSLTKSPLPSVKVTLLCWYRAGWDKNDYVYIDTIADINGCYSATFEDGYKVVVASVADKYYPNLAEYYVPENNNLELSLALSRSPDTNSAQPKINLRNYIVQNGSN